MPDPYRRARLALASDRYIQRALRGLWALHGGVWLGVMDDNDLARATELFYARSERWSDEGLVARGLSDWEAAAVAEFFPPTGRVLVPAAGAGREMLGLLAMGYDVVGFDPSDTLVAKGRRILSTQGRSDALRSAPPDTVPPGLNGRFDAILLGWGGISHVRGRQRRVDFLSELRSVCSDGAPMLISFLPRDQGARAFDVTRSVARAIRRLRQSDTAIELGDTVSGSFDHYFTFDEIAGELSAAGFEERERRAAPHVHIVATAR
jgi:hypothetical protein